MCFSAKALDPSLALTQYQQKNWTNTDGLPQNTVTALTQTKDGYLWIGTLEGLVRFDGLQFTHFNSRTHSAFKHNMVTRLFTDQHGTLWIGTSGGGLLSYQQSEFTNHIDSGELKHARILAIFEDSNNHLWIGSDGEGLTKLTNGRFEAQHSIVDAGKSIRAIAENDSGLWVASELGLVNINQQNQAELFASSIDFANNTIRSLFFDHQNTLWMGTDSGIYLLHNQQIKAPNELPDFAKNTALAITQDNRHNYWIATEHSGLLRVSKDFEGQVLGHQQTPTEDSQQQSKSQALFQGRAINTIFFDDEGNLWAGSHLFGLSQIRQTLLTPFGPPEGLTASSSRSIYQKKDGTLLVGLEGGGVSYLEQGEFKALPTRYGLDNAKVYSILEDANGELWFGTENGITRIYRDQEGNEQVETIATQDGLLSNIILALHESTNGDIWIGSFAGGLNRWRDGEMTSYSKAQGLDDSIVNVILEDAQQNLWIGTRGGGLFRFKNHHFERFSTENGLSDDLVFSLYQDDSGTLWVGTYGGGLNRLKNGELTQIRLSDGLFDDVIHKIIEDQYGYFWMSSNRGIFKVSKSDLNAVADGRLEKLESTVFGLNQGMRNVECNGGSNAGLITAQGTIWFPTADGVIRVNPSERPQTLINKPPIIESFALNGEALGFTNLDNIEKRSGSIEINYTATHLTHPENTRFRYKLVNNDQEWTEAGTRRTAYYSALPSGEYRFRVMATTDGTWNGPQTDLLFSIKPRYYETWWFRLLILSCLIVLGYLLHSLRLVRIKHRNQQLEQLIRKRTIELESANLKLARIATEDSLTGILNRRAFNEIFLNECRRVQRKNGAIGLMLVDIDYFKQYNDSLGHPAGDSCIKAIADLLTHSCNRASEFVTRYGGDEFAIIFSDAELEKIENYAAIICERVFQKNLPHPDSPIADRVTITIGVGVLTSASETSMDSIISLADDALYQAKKKGRNQSVCLFD